MDYNLLYFLLKLIILPYLFFFFQLILIIYIIYIYWLKFKSNIEYNCYLNDFLFNSISIIFLKNNNSIKSKIEQNINIIIINIFDKILDFTEYFLFLFLTFFFFPERLFWYAYIVDKFLMQDHSLNRINYDIFNNIFSYNEKFKFKDIFPFLKRRWFIDFKFFFLIYSLYLKLIIRLFFFFFYNVFLYLVFIIKNIIKTIFFNLFIIDLISYIYIFFIFRIYLKIKNNYIKSFWAIFDYLKYEFVFFSYFLPYFFFVNFFVSVVNNIFKKTLSIYNIYRFNFSGEHIIPYKESKFYLKKILPIFYNFFFKNIIIYFKLNFLYLRNFFLFFYFKICYNIKNLNNIYLFFLFIKEFFFYYHKKFLLLIFIINFCFFFNIYILFIIILIYYFIFKNKIIYQYNNLFNIVFYFSGCLFWIFVYFLICIFKNFFNISVFFVKKLLKYFLYFFIFLLIFILLNNDFYFIFLRENEGLITKIFLIFEHYTLSFYGWKDEYFFHCSFVLSNAEEYFKSYSSHLNRKYTTTEEWNIYKNLFGEKMITFFHEFKVILKEYIKHPLDYMLNIGNIDKVDFQYNFLMWKIKRHLNKGMLLYYSHWSHYLNQHLWKIKFYIVGFLKPAYLWWFYEPFTMFSFLFCYICDLCYMQIPSACYVIFCFIFHWIPYNIIPYFISIYYFIFGIFFKIKYFLLMNNIVFIYIKFLFIKNLYIIIIFFLEFFYLIYLSIFHISLIELYPFFDIIFYVICEFNNLCLKNFNLYLNIFDCKNMLLFFFNFHLLIFLKIQENLDILCSLFHISEFKFNRWNNWKRLYVSVTAEHPILAISSDAEDVYSESHYNFIFPFRGDFLIFNNLYYFFSSMKHLWEEINLIHIFISNNYFIYPFYLRWMKIFSVIHYYILIFILRILIYNNNNNNDNLIFNGHYLWKKVVKESQLYLVKNIKNIFLERDILNFKLGNILNKTKDIKKILVKFFKIHFFYLNKVLNLFLIKKKRNISNLKSLYNLKIIDFLNKFQNKFENSILYEIKINKFFKIFNKINLNLLGEFLGKKKKEDVLQFFVENYKKNYFHVLNINSLKLKSFLILLYKKNKYSRKLIIYQEDVEELHYFFSDSNKMERLDLKKSHQEIMYKILNYFENLDIILFKNKGPNWLLHKNLYTLFFNNNLGVEVILIQNFPILDKNFFLLFIVPFFLLLFSYFNGLHFETYTISYIKLIYLYLSMLLDNYEFFFNLNVDIFDYMDLVSIGWWAQNSVAANSTEYYTWISSKIGFILNFYEYKKLYYFHEDQYLFLYSEHPLFSLKSKQLNSIFFMHFIFFCILFIYFVFNRSFLFYFNLKIDFTQVQIKNKIIMAIYKHYYFIFNKKKLLYLKKNIKL